jgi:glycosyltransferase involved in cell wall biosynthesis
MARLLQSGALHSFGPNPGGRLEAGSKVLLVGDYPPPHGGVAVHVDELQRAIRAAGGEAVVLDIGKGQLPTEGVIPAGSPAQFLLQLALHVARGFLVHVHTGGANRKSWMLASLCAAAGRASGRPAVLSLHSGLGPAWLAESQFRRAVAARVGGAFGAVVAASHPIARTLRICGVPAARISVMPAFSRALLAPGPPPPRLEEIRREGQPVLCAMLAPGKVYGAEVLLRAFARLRAAVPRAQLVLYGAGTADASLRALARQLCGASAEAVHGLGELARPAALGLISQSDLFVRPTLADGDSVSVREALALGRRVVATAVGTRPAGVLLVPPGDDLQLARALREALAAPVAASGPAEGASAGVESFARLFDLYRGADVIYRGADVPASTPHSPEGQCAASAAS